MNGIDEDTVWTNASVRTLAADHDPIQTIAALAHRLLLEAADAGVTGPPTNPLELAALMGIAVRPRFDVADARLVSAPGADTSSPSAAAAARRTGVPAAADSPARLISGTPLAHFVTSPDPLILEFNPTRPRGRLRYSIAHELGHALFPDASEEVRQRTHTGAVAGLDDNDAWQLELLCNIAAAEILMPADAVNGLTHTDLDIDFLMDQRARFDVSTEALLRRLVHATDRPVALAAFARRSDVAASPLRCEYLLPSRAWSGTLDRGVAVAADTPVGAPVAVGQTARGEVVLNGESFRVQAVGVPPYPGAVFPRVLGLFEPVAAVPVPHEALTYVTADISSAVDDAPAIEGSAALGEDTAPSAPTPVLIAHVVSDSARAWGRFGVASALRAVVPHAAEAFRNWAVADEANLTLGQVHLVQVSTPRSGRQVWVASLVAQHGFGPSTTPRLSYVALAEALQSVADAAARLGAEVRIPRLGAGQAGGRWDVVEATLERTLLTAGVRTTVYTMPTGPRPPAPGDQRARRARQAQ